MARKDKPGKRTTADLEAAEPAQEAVRVELRQLAGIRAKYPALAHDVAEGLLASHPEEQCRERGGASRSADTFRGAMTWARTVGEKVGDPGLAPMPTRWMLDCLTSLGLAMTQSVAPENPARASAIADAEASAAGLLAETRANLGHAVGTHPAWRSALAAAVAVDPAEGDANLARLQKLAALVRVWVASPKGAPPIVAFDVDAKTADALDAQRAALEAALVDRPAPRQVDRDGPAINIVEGRLYFAMRVVWDRLAAARKKGTSRLQLTVTPTLLRGIDVNRHKKKVTPPEG